MPANSLLEKTGNLRETDIPGGGPRLPPYACSILIVFALLDIHGDRSNRTTSLNKLAQYAMISQKAIQKSSSLNLLYVH